MSALGGCWHLGFAALWLLLNFYPKRRSCEVICPSPAGSTSYLHFSGVAVYAGTSVPLFPLPPSPLSPTFGCVSAGRFKEPSL